MIISCFVITDHSLLDTFGSHFQRQMDFPIFSPLCRKYAKLDSIQCISCISAGYVRQKLHCILIDLGTVASHSLFLVIDRPFDQGFDILFFQRPQFKNAGSGNKRSIYLKIGILRCCTDKNNGAVLYKRKEIVLLPLVKPMDLVYKEDRLFPVHSPKLLCLLHHRFHVFFSCHCGVDLSKFCACRMSDHLSKRCLPCPRRAVKDD